MGKKALSNRDNWQEKSGIKALAAETHLYDVFEEYFKETVYKLHRKPKHLKNLYSKVILSQEVLSQIYTPPDEDLSLKEWGVSPDFAIENTLTEKILFGEIKRQDGWVEDKEPKDGRGNAHERLCKLFTPGLMTAYRDIGKISSPDILPFWVVFQGDITRDPKRNREIAFWFSNYDKNFFMWRPFMTGEDLINHFERYLKKYLD